VSRAFNPTRQALRPFTPSRESHLRNQHETANQIYNVAVGERTTLNDLYNQIHRRLLPHNPHLHGAQPGYRDFRPGDVRHSLADISKAATRLDTHPPTDSARDWKLPFPGKACTRRAYRRLRIIDLPTGRPRFPAKAEVGAALAARCSGAPDQAAEAAPHCRHVGNRIGQKPGAEPARA
jgi:hypothetical protein